MLSLSLVWGFQGSIPTSVSGSGVILRQGGVKNVVTRASGVLLELNAKVGDRVEANQVVARVAQPAIVEKLKLAHQMLDRAKRERNTALQLTSSQARLRTEAVKRQIENARGQIRELENQARLANEQVRTQQELLAKGLVTQQQAIHAQQEQSRIQQEIAGREADIKQLQAQSFEFESRPAENDSEVRSRIAEMERDLAQMEHEFELNSSVVTPYAGEVIELKAYPGGTIEAETPVLSIQPGTDSLEVLSYVPSLQAKEIKVGMEAQVSPSIVKREEYGFIRGTVVAVSNFPSTKASLMRNFENDALVTSLTNTGPVTEVRVAMHINAKTPSGFQWSSSQGPQLSLSSGTMCTLQVVTQRQKPVSLLLPFLKGKLGIS
jgi:HlyD family secretion protein